MTRTLRQMDGKTRTAMFAVMALCFMTGLAWASVPALIACSARRPG